MAETKLSNSSSDRASAPRTDKTAPSGDRLKVFIPAGPASAGTSRFSWISSYDEIEETVLAELRL